MCVCGMGWGRRGGGGGSAFSYVRTWEAIVIYAGGILASYITRINYLEGQVIKPSWYPLGRVTFTENSLPDTHGKFSSPRMKPAAQRTQATWGDPGVEATWGDPGVEATWGDPGG